MAVWIQLKARKPCTLSFKSLPLPVTCSIRPPLSPVLQLCRDTQRTCCRLRWHEQVRAPPVTSAPLSCCMPSSCAGVTSSSTHTLLCACCASRGRCAQAVAQATGGAVGAAACSLLRTLAELWCHALRPLLQLKLLVHLPPAVVSRPWVEVRGVQMEFAPLTSLSLSG